MRIRQIRLKNNYKRFHDLTINLGETPKKIIALVGPNGSGKSSVFDGMMFLNGQIQGSIGSFGPRDQAFHSMTNSPIDQSAIEITFNNNETHHQVLEKKRLAGNPQTTFSYRNPYRFNSNLNVTTQAAIPDIKLNNYGASLSVDLDDKMTQNYQRLNIYLNDYRKENDLTDKQANEQVIGELNIILSDCLGITISDHGDIMANRGMLYFKKDNQPTEFQFNVLSSGEKEVVDILLDIYLKRQEFNETIYIIDEPELHLNTGIQRKVFSAIERLIPDTCQIWIATHSIGFLTALQNELNDVSDVIYFSGDFSTAPATLTPIIKTRKNWQMIFKTALEDLTGLLAPSLIVYCEGRELPTAAGDEQGVDAEIYNQIFSETNPDILFVSSGGSTMPDKYAAIALTVLNKAFKDVSLLLLKDKDINGDGSITTEEQRLAYIALNSKLHRMLSRKEMENYLFDYEIISKAYGIDRNAYNVIIPDIMDDVKSKTGDLMKLCGIHTGLNAAGFKKHLSTFVTPDTSIFNDLHSVIFA